MLPTLRAPRPAIDDVGEFFESWRSNLPKSGRINTFGTRSCQPGSPAMNQSHKPHRSSVLMARKPAVRLPGAADEAASRDIPLRLLYAIEPDDPGMPHTRGGCNRRRRERGALRVHSGRVADRSRSRREITPERPVTSLIRASAAAALVWRWRYRRAPSTGAGGTHRSGPGVGRRAQCGDRVISLRVRWDATPHGSSSRRTGRPISVFLLGAVMPKHGCATAGLVVTCRQSGVGDTGTTSASLDRWLAR